MSKKKSRSVCLFDVLVKELHETSKLWGPKLKIGWCQEIISGFLGFKSYASMTRTDMASNVEYLHSLDMPWIPLKFRIFTHPSDVVPNIALAHERALKVLGNNNSDHAQKNALWVVDYLVYFDKNTYQKLYYYLKYELIKQRAFDAAEVPVKLHTSWLKVLLRDGFVDSIRSAYGDVTATKYRNDLVAAIRNTPAPEKLEGNPRSLSKVSSETIKTVLFGHFYSGQSIDGKLTRESLITNK